MGTDAGLLAKFGHTMRQVVGPLGRGAVGPLGRWAVGGHKLNRQRF